MTMKLNQLNTNKIKGFEGLDLDKILMRFIDFPKKNITLKELAKYMWNTRFFNRFDYKYIKNEKNNMLGIYSDLYYREDHYNIFINFIKEFNFFDYIIPVKNKDRFNLKRGIHMVISDFNIWKSLRKLDLDIYHKLWLLMRMGLVKRYSDIIFEIISEKEYEYVLVYNDSCPYENIIIQKMNQKGVYTATLQHGKFDLNGNWKGIEYKASVAKDFLAWNEWTRDLAKEAGLTNVKVLGIPRYIKRRNINRNKIKTSLFCVILGDKASHDENLILVEMAEQLAEKLNKKFYIRFHPANINNDYTLGLNEKFYQSFEGQEDIFEMCEKSDFCITGSGTSMGIDLIYLGHKFYEYNKISQKYRNNTFFSFEELLRLVKEETIINLEGFTYYCTTYDVKNSYLNYFNKIIEGEA